MRARLCVRARLYLCVQVCVYMYVSLCVSVCASVCVCVSVCLCVRVLCVKSGGRLLEPVGTNQTTMNTRRL